MKKPMMIFRAKNHRLVNVDAIKDWEQEGFTNVWFTPFRILYLDRLTLVRIGFRRKQALANGSSCQVARCRSML